jgi:hypothetical protein
MACYRHALVSLAIVLQATGLGVGLCLAADESNYSIMAPEPGVPPRYRSPRGLPQRPDSAQTRPAPPPAINIAKPAPPIVLPNGQSVPNLPPVRQGIVPGGGRETFGDRAARCAHQSGLYGVPAGQQNAYMHSCTMR